MSKTRVINALRDEIWALTPAKLSALMDFVDALAAGTNLPFDAASPGGRPRETMGSVENGVAVISIEGVMTRRANMVNKASGGTSSQLIASAIVDSAETPGVNAIVLDIDSPGGSVHAPQEIGQAIVQARQSVPVIAWTGGAMNSAAYWVASQCDAIVAQDTAQVGSIGVAMEHRDRSAADAKEGITRTFITSGKYKRMGNDAEPLSDEAAAYLQDKADTYYTKFIDAVAAGRGVDVATVLERMADGRIFIGAEALTAGLVDAIGPFDTALELARDKRRNSMPTKDANASTQLSGATLDTLAQERPDLLAEARSGYVPAAEAETSQAAAVTAERARIVEIMEAGGDAAITLQAIKDGTPSAAVYKSFFEATKTQQQTALNNLDQSLSQHAGAAGASTVDRQGNGPTFDSLVAAEMDAGKTRGQAIKAVASANPELHQQWIAAQNTK